MNFPLVVEVAAWVYLLNVACTAILWLWDRLVK
jgi:hypothetical protein